MAYRNVTKLSLNELKNVIEDSDNALAKAMLAQYHLLEDSVLERDAEFLAAFDSPTGDSENER